MELITLSTNEINQNGGYRRGDGTPMAIVELV